MQPKVSRLMIAFLAGVTLLGACGQPDTLPSPTSTDLPAPPASVAPQAATGAATAATARPAPTAAAPDNQIAGAASTKTHLPLVVQEPDVAVWSQLGGNPQRTGYVPTSLKTTWQYKWIWNGPAGGGDGGAPASHLLLPQGVQPVAGDGKLFIGHSDGVVRALYESSGAVAWSQSVGGEVLNTAAYDPATNTVFVTSTSGQLVQLNATNGSIVNSFNAGSSMISAPLLYENTVFVSTTGGSLIGIDTYTLIARWTYAAGAEIRASPTYSTNHGGLVIIAAEDKSIHAIHAADGTLAWRTVVKADQDPIRDNKSFTDTYPVVSDANDVVIIRPYFDWDKIWTPTGGAPSSVAEIRSFLTNNPGYQSLHVLRLSDGTSAFVAPVMGGAIGNNDDLYSTPPQVVVKTLADGSELAYLLWRNRQACIVNVCDGREDTTLGEMDLSTGNIRFVQDHKNQGSMRLPTDEQGALSMAGDTLLHAHWMLLGGVRITDRSASLGGSRSNPIRASEVVPIGNTLAAGTCNGRNSATHSCPVGFSPPNDAWLIDAGFYIYYNNQQVYDTYWAPPVRGAVISSGNVYWRSSDGAIIALKAH